MGDPIKLVMLEKVLHIVERDKMTENAVTTGNYFLCELEKLQCRHPNFFSNARGRGLFAAVDVPYKTRECFIQKLLQNGMFFRVFGLGFSFFGIARR